MIQEIIAFDAALITLKAKAKSILRKVQTEKGRNYINLADHNLQCQVLLSDRYGCVLVQDVKAIRIIDTPQPNTVQIITGKGVNYLSECEGYSDVDVYKLIVENENEI